MGASSFTQLTEIREIAKMISQVSRIIHSKIGSTGSLSLTGAYAADQLERSFVFQKITIVFTAAIEPRFKMRQPDELNVTAAVSVLIVLSQKV